MGAFHSTKDSGLNFRNFFSGTWDNGRFPFNQKFRKFRNGDKWYGNFLGKFPENPEIVEFPKSKPFNRKFRKFREENQMERKFPVRNFWKFGYTSRGCPLFRKFRKMLFHSPLEISGNANRNFLSNGKRPTFSDISGKKTTLRGIPKFSEMAYREFPFHLIFLSKFPEFSVERFDLGNSTIFRFTRNFPGNFPTICSRFEISGILVDWFALWKFNNFRIFWNLSLEISILFVPVSIFSEFLVEWKAPLEIYQDV